MFHMPKKTATSNHAITGFGVVTITVKAALIASIAMSTFVVTGCSDSHSDPDVRAEMDVPPPAPDVPMEIAHACIDADEEYAVGLTPDDFGVGTDKFANSGSMILRANPTVGLFPTGIAVAQLQLDENAPGRQFKVVMPNDIDQVHWNHVFDDIPQVRDMVLGDRYAIRPSIESLAPLMQTSIAKECRLCLTWSRSGDPKFHTEYVAVLWDAATSEAVATFRASVPVDPAFYEYSTNRKVNKSLKTIDERCCRSDFLGARVLEQQVLKVVMDIAARDDAAPMTQPSPWINDRPLMPRDGLPRGEGTRYWP